MSYRNNNLTLNLLQCESGSFAVDGVCFHTDYVFQLNDSINSLPENVVNISQPVHVLTSLFQRHGICHFIVGQFLFYSLPKLTCRTQSLAHVQNVQSKPVYNGCKIGQMECLDGTCVSEWVFIEGKQPCTVFSSGLHVPISTVLGRPFSYHCGKLNFPWYRVCDGVKNCLNGEDEELCINQLITTPMPFILNQEGFQNQWPMTGEYEACTGKFMCVRTNLCIPQEQVNDLFPECPLLTNESMSSDEPLLHVVPPDYNRDILWRCKLDHHLPCLLGHPRCFPRWFVSIRLRYIRPS